jgi:threonine aldolase
MTVDSVPAASWSGLVIDCRSDAITQPTEEMWDAMRSAEVGWGMQGEDRSINELQAYAAGMTGMDAALYVPSGTMGNLVAMMTHTTRGDHFIAEAHSHVLWSEQWSYAYICGAVGRPIQGDRGVMAPSDVEEALEERRFGHRPRFRLLCLENTHNMAGGTITSLTQVRALSAVARRHGMSIHTDGARILNACAASDVSLQLFARECDTLTLNLNKGLSAPEGALLCGSAQLIDECRLNLRRLGGWSATGKAGPQAAAGLVALKTMIPQLREDNRRARALALGLAELEAINVDLETVQTNIVMVRLSESFMSTERFLEELQHHGVRAYYYLPDTARFVLHRHISDADVARIIDVVRTLATRAQ